MARQSDNRQMVDRWLVRALPCARLLALVFFVLGGIALAKDRPLPWFWWFAFGTGGLYVAMTFLVWWRDVWCCPHCQTFLNEDYVRMRFCPQCGRRLASPPKADPDEKREGAE